MKFFNSSKSIVPFPRSVDLPEASYANFSNPDETLIVDGQLNVPRGHCHLYYKNIVVTPRGQINAESLDMVAEEKIVNYGSINTAKIGIFKTGETFINNAGCIQGDPLRIDSNGDIVTLGGNGRAQWMLHRLQLNRTQEHGIQQGQKDFVKYSVRLAENALRCATMGR